MSNTGVLDDQHVVGTHTQVTGLLYVDRVLYSSVVYPHNYGMVVMHMLVMHRHDVGAGCVIDVDNSPTPSRRLSPTYLL